MKAKHARCGSRPTMNTTKTSMRWRFRCSMLARMATKRPSTNAQTQPDNAVVSQQAYLAVARSLIRLDRSLCGLWPVPADVGLEGPARQLAAALAVLGHNVALVAPRSRWQQDVSSSEPPLSLSPADEGFDVLTPAWPRGADPSTVIERTLTLIRDRYARVVLDLSGLDILGVDQSAIVPGLDVVLFVTAGRTDEFALARVRRRLPPERILGAVLVDAVPLRTSNLESEGLPAHPLRRSPSEETSALTEN